MENGSLWARSDQRFLTNLQQPTIRREMEDFKAARGMRHDEPMGDGMRREFDREMLKKYARSERPPAHVKWILKIWSFVPPEK